MKARGRSLGFAVLFLAACGFLADWFVIKSPLLVWLTQGREVIAEVDGHPILRIELEQALRAHLWVRGTSWPALDAAAQQSTRTIVLDQLINDRLVRAARLREAPTEVSALAPVRFESDMHRRQFAEAGEFPQRLAAQHHTQKSFDAAIQDAQLDEAWLAKKIALHLSEKEVRAWYDQFKETLRIPQAHHAAHIFLAGGGNNKIREAEIRQIHRQLIANEKNFATLATSRSEDARSKAYGGDLGWFTRQRMPADFIAAVEKLRVGRLSTPISTRLGWHLIIVRERRPSRLPTWEEAKVEISAVLTTRQRKEALKTLLSTLLLHSAVIRHPSLISSISPAL